MQVLSASILALSLTAIFGTSLAQHHVSMKPLVSQIQGKPDYDGTPVKYPSYFDSSSDFKPVENDPPQPEKYKPLLASQLPDDNATAQAKEVAVNASKAVAPLLTSIQDPAVSNERVLDLRQSWRISFPNVSFGTDEKGNLLLTVELDGATFTFHGPLHDHGGRVSHAKKPQHKP